MPLHYLSIILVVIAFCIGYVTTEGDSSTSEARAVDSVKLSHWEQNNCGHPRDVRDAKRLSKRAWSRAHGPTKKDRRLFKVLKKCARTQFQAETRFQNIWKSLKESLEGQRKLARLSAECGQSPTSAVVSCIEYASLVHNYPLATLYRIASCESTLNPYARNPSGASGLFQFMPSTFAKTPYGNENIMSARYNSLAAAWKMNAHGTDEWVCQ